MHVTSFTGKLLVPLSHLISSMPETDQPAPASSEPLITHIPSAEKPIHGSLVRTVICELRFPLLPELGNDQPPGPFVKALRKRYPQLEHMNEVSLGLGNTTTTSAHIFRGLRGGWAVTLKQSAVALEAKAYPGYEKFRERVVELIEAAALIIDSDFWTRVGLRYINELPLERATSSSLGKIINPALAAPVDSNVFLRIRDVGGRIQGGDEAHGYLLQHALKLEKSTKGTTELGYTIDVDVWRTEVELVHTLDVLDDLHRESFAIFDWTLGAASREKLSAE